ncbi:Tll0287-like domain-containing protein [Permianibacter aggregans]|uniref:Uncharacterized protein DUF3365 n=1 Tax=Permianibacter aggregans TaxID=1510150 RepID=A0A4R6UZ02_9GAMM|nr:DUF3365 domain-containing protein [Permianibacter aggregans]QGX41548.1 DUF3365 domain-containing protein [Permianibacter aggregans]TDQ51349.1 uncharacterized protein DUF3365 [Permianibacter aggregans]
MKKPLIISIGVAALLGCSEQASKPSGIEPQRFTDAIHTVLEADRTIYTQKIVNRLTLEEKNIKASEHWQEEKALALPAQMFRMGAELVNEKNPGFSYALISEWAINKKNAARTEAEKQGMKAVVENPKKPFYTEEMLGDKKYFTAVYADVAIADACVQCHNEHKDSPRTDFKKGDVMGAVVIRVEQAK